MRQKPNGGNELCCAIRVKAEPVDPGLPGNELTYARLRGRTSSDQHFGTWGVSKNVVSQSFATRSRSCGLAQRIAGSASEGANWKVWAAAEAERRQRSRVQHSQQGRRDVRLMPDLSVVAQVA